MTYRIEAYGGGPPPSIEYAIRAAKRRHAAYLGNDRAGSGTIPQEALDPLTARKMGTDGEAILVAVHEGD